MVVSSDFNSFLSSRGEDHEVLVTEARQRDSWRAEMGRVGGEGEY